MLIIFILACFLILLDQLSKNFIVNHFSLGESKEVITNFFSISSHRNRGAAWGILQDSRLFFIIVTIIFIAILTYYLFKQKYTLSTFDKGTFTTTGLTSQHSNARRQRTIGFHSYRRSSYSKGKCNHRTS